MKEKKGNMALIERQPRVLLRIFLVVVFILGTATILSLGVKIRNTVDQQATDALMRECAQSVNNVEIEITSRMKALRALAARLVIRDGLDMEKTVDSMSTYSTVYGFYNLGLFDTNGKGYTTLGEKFDLGNEDYFLQALEGKQVLTESRVSEDGKTNLNIFATPLFQSGEVCAVLTATYLSSDFRDLLNKKFMGGKGQSLVLDREGRVISLPYDYEDTNDELRFIQQSRELAAELIQNRGLQTFEYEGETYASYSTALSLNNWYVMSYISYDYFYQDAAILKKYILAALILLYLCILGTSILCVCTYERLSRRVVDIAFTDDLTGAKNYAYLKMYFGNLTPAQRQRKYLVLFDVDKFKFINILHGTERGDQLLQFILQVFRETLPDEYIFKAYADAFIAVMDGENREAVTEKIQRFSRNLTERSEKENMIPFAVSFGICRMDQNEELRLVYDDALLAKKEAKTSLDKKYKFFDRIEKEKVRRQEVESAFEDALRNGEFKVWYQPKYNMATKEICGSEALVRWLRPDGSLISPGAFIPILEENGKIVELDETMIRMVCRDLKEMEAMGIETKPVSVNLSKMHLRRIGIVEKIVEIVEQTKVDKSKIAFEITESATYEDRKLLNGMVRALQKEGFLVDMDDYGTGSSTLKSLSSTSFDTLKLDKSFIDHIGTEKMDIIIRSTIQMARQLSMELVAEGVENEEQARFLLENECHVVQGYYFFKPLEKKDYIRLLRGDMVTASPCHFHSAENEQ